jgi:hypothetical protein
MSCAVCHQTGQALPLARFWSDALYSTFPAILESSATRSIGFEVHTKAGIIPGFLSCKLILILLEKTAISVIIAAVLRHIALSITPPKMPLCS